MNTRYCMQWVWNETRRFSTHLCKSARSVPEFGRYSGAACGSMQTMYWAAHLCSMVKIRIRSLAPTSLKSWTIVTQPDAGRAWKITDSLLGSTGLRIYMTPRTCEFIIYITPLQSFLQSTDSGQAMMAILHLSFPTVFKSVCLITNFLFRMLTLIGTAAAYLILAKGNS